MSDFPNNARASTDLTARLDATRSTALKVGGVASIATLAAAVLFPATAMPAYLAAFLFWVGVSLGSIGLCLLFQLVGGSWQVPLRRMFEAAGWQILLMAVFFVPILVGLKSTYAWTDPQAVDAVEVVAHKVKSLGFLTPTNFAIRAAIYFAIWTGVAYMVGAWSRAQDDAADDAPTRRLIGVSGPSTVVMFLTASFAAFDWGMSRDPDWYSTIYGAMYVIGTLLTTLALVAIFAVRNSSYEPIKSALTVGRLNDLGNLLLTFTMLWAYFSFSQFLITWLGNLPEEVIWYERRIQGTWGVIALGLIAFGFFAPFLALLQRKHKQDTAWVLPIATWIVVMRTIDIAWLVLPGYSKLGSEWTGFPWGSVLFYYIALLGIGGIWTAGFLRTLMTAPLVPLRDPTVIAALEHDRDHAHEPSGDPVL